VPQLSALGLLTALDRGVIAGGCQWWAMYVDAVKDIAENGTTFTMTSSGFQGPRPSVGVAIKSWQQYLAFAARFGLTPADRSRLSVPEKRTDDLNDILSQAEAVVEKHESESA
jgi:P27 family predicted phage terminase small subunit